MKRLLLILLLSSSGLLFGQATTAPSTTNAVPYYANPGNVQGVAGPTSPNGVPQVLTSTPSGGNPGVPAWVPIGTLLNSQIQVTPSSLTYPGTPVGGSSLVQSVTVTNVGTPLIVFSGITVTGDYSQTNTCGASLAQGVSCTVSVTFSPTVAGSRTGTLSIADHVSGSPQTVSLSGTGLSSPTLSSLALTPSNPTVTIPNTQQFTATCTPSAGPTYNCTPQMVWNDTGGGGGSPWTLVNSSISHASYLTSLTNGNKTCGSVPNTIHNLLKVRILEYNATAVSPTVTDTPNGGSTNTWDLTTVVSNNGLSYQLYEGYAINSATGPNTISVSAAVSYLQIECEEWSGNDTTLATVLDTQGGQSGSTAAMSSGNITTAGTFDLMDGTFLDTRATGGSMVIGNGFGQVFTSNSLSLGEYLTGLSAGTYSASGTDPGSTYNWIGMADAYMGTGSSPFSTVTQTGLLTAQSAGTSALVAQGGTPTVPTPNRASSFLSTCSATCTSAVLLPNPQFSGDSNFVSISWGAATGTVTSVADSCGNSYSAAGTVEAANSLSTVLYFASPILPCASNSITVAMGQTTSHLGIAAEEIFGTVASSIQDGSAVNSTGSSGPATGSITPGNTNDVIVGSIGVASGQTVNSTSPPFVIDTTSPGGSALIRAPSFSTNATASSSVLSGGGYVQQLAAFQVVAGSTSPVIANTVVTNVYYLSPSNGSPFGNDSNACTIGAPCLTFARVFALEQSNGVGASGTQIFLLNGTYGVATGTGFLNANCAIGGGNLTSGTGGSAQVTIQALNERQAWIKGDGSTPPLQVQNCSYITIRGLQVSDSNNASLSESYTFGVVNSSHITIVRNIVHHTNQLVNEHALGLQGTCNSLVQENEVYYYHRHAFIDYQNNCTATNGNEWQRNYSNARGWGSGSTVGNGVGFMQYGAQYGIEENNISENNAPGAGMDTEAITGGSNVTHSSFLGSVSLKDNQGIAGTPHQSGTCPSNGTYTNDVVVTPLEILWEARGVQSFTFTNISGFQSSTGIVNYFEDSANFSGCTPSVTITNSDILNGGSVTGYNNALDGSCTPGSCTLGTLTLNYDGYFGSGSYSASATVTNQFSTNPALGSCLLWVPTASPAKGVGLGGADIGADVLYEYNSGTLGSTALWSTAAQCKIIGGVQQADCPVGAGALVAGLNDQAGASYGDVGNRLNVNKAGCGYPTGYTPAP